MPMELFHKMIPFLKYTELIYLQGWGEPLLNDNFFHMVRICKDRGKRVGFTTNGMLLTEETIQTLIDLQLDIICISLAGTTAGTHDQIRKGTDFNRIIVHLERLQEMKAERNSRFPAVHFAYLMLKSNFHELKNILTVAKKVEAKQIVASNLALIVDPELSEEAVFHDTERTDYYRNTLQKIKHEATLEDIIFGYHGTGLDDASIGCRENVRHACVVNVEGEVVPCVLTNPVLCDNHEPSDYEPRRYIFKDQSFSPTALSFGNIQNESLTRIWYKKEYLHFRSHFDSKGSRDSEQICQEMLPFCVRCYKKLGV